MELFEDAPLVGPAGLRDAADAAATPPALPPPPAAASTSAARPPRPRRGSAPPLPLRRRRLRWATPSYGSRHLPLPARGGPRPTGADARRASWSNLRRGPRPSSGPPSRSCARSATSRPRLEASADHGRGAGPARRHPARGGASTVLARMARIAAAGHAAFWVPQAGAPPRAATLLALQSDPILASAAALRHVLESAARGAKPAFAFGAENLDLGQALDRRRARGILAVPSRTRAGCRARASSTTGRTRAAGPGGARAPRRDPALARRGPGAGRDPRRREGRRAALELALAGAASLRASSAW